METRHILLVIDMLEDFFKESGSLAAMRPRLVAAINELVRTFRVHRQQVVWIRQEFRPDLADAFLDMRRRNRRVTIGGTSGAQIISELERAPTDPVIVKKRYSAFFGTSLGALLDDIAPETLVVAGINTHACIRTTVIDAYQRDYEVVVAAEGVASYDQAHHDMTVSYLDGRIARFMKNDKICRLLGESCEGLPSTGN